MTGKACEKKHLAACYHQGMTLYLSSLAKPGTTEAAIRSTNVKELSEKMSSVSTSRSKIALSPSDESYKPSDTSLKSFGITDTVYSSLCNILLTISHIIHKVADLNYILLINY